MSQEDSCDSPQLAFASALPSSLSGKPDLADLADLQVLSWRVKSEQGVGVPSPGALGSVTLEGIVSQALVEA